MLNKTPHSIYKIRFNDCDMFGHLNNARYLDYMINAREDHLITHYDFDFDKFYKNDFGWVINSHEIIYVRPAIYNEIVSIQSTLLMVREDLLFVEALMMNETRDQLKAIMRSKLVPINLKTGRKELHPTELMEWAKQLENTEILTQGDLETRIKLLMTELKEKKNSVVQ